MDSWKICRGGDDGDVDASPGKAVVLQTPFLMVVKV